MHHLKYPELLHQITADKDLTSGKINHSFSPSLWFHTSFTKVINYLLFFFIIPILSLFAYKENTLPPTKISEKVF